MKKILVPIDFSDNSIHAFHYALALGKTMKSEITLLHTFHLTRKTGFSTSLNHRLITGAKADIQKMIDAIPVPFHQTPIQSRVLKGKAADTIVSAYTSGDYDLLVMGTKGASGLKEIFIGSVAGHVVANANKPVIVVPETYVFKNIRTIVLAVSDVQMGTTEVLQPLLQICSAFKARIEVFQLLYQAEANHNLDDITKHLEGLTFSSNYEVGKPDEVEQRINNFVNKVDAELTCLIRRRKDVFQKLFGKSVTLKQTFQSTVPLLILHNQSA